MKLKLGQVVYIGKREFKTMAMVKCKKRTDIDIYVGKQETIEKYELVSVDKRIILWLIIYNEGLDNETFYLCDECDVQLDFYDIERVHEKYEHNDSMDMEISDMYGDAEFYTGRYYHLQELQLGDRRAFIENCASNTNVYYGDLINSSEITILPEVRYVKKSDIKANNTFHFLKMLGIEIAVCVILYWIMIIYINISN